MNDEDRGGDIVVHYDDDYDYLFLVCVEQSMLKTVPLTVTPDLALHKGSCHLRFSGFCRLRGYPPPS